MTKPSELYRYFVNVIKARTDGFPAAPSQCLVHVCRKMACAQRVLKPVMRGSRKNIVRRAKLFQLAKTLDLRGVNGVDHSARKILV